MGFIEVLKNKYEFIDNEYAIEKLCIDEYTLNKCLNNKFTEPFYIHKYCTELQLKILEENRVVIKINEYKKLKISSINETEEDYKLCEKIQKVNIVVNDEGQSFMYIKQKYIPLTIKYLSTLRKYDVFHEMIMLYINYLAQKNYIFKDFKIHFDKQESLILPISINNILNYYNKKELFLSEYKKAELININYNKKDINYSYCLIKIKDKITEKSFAKMQQEKEISSYVIKKIDSKNFISDFCKYYFIKKYGLDFKELYNQEDIIYIEDYIKFCKELKYKIDLTISLKRLINEHNNLSNIIINKMTKKVEIPKNSKFNILKKYLPKDFERIKNKKRLVHEGSIQNHCVATYAKLINNDKSAIYSYMYEGKRVTLEIIKKRNKYIVKQAMYKFNVPVEKEEVERINKILNKINSDI